jgi:hypothetical protein
MIRRFTLSLALVLGSLLAWGLPRPVQADFAPDEVLAAAKSGLPVLLKTIPTIELARYGFANRQEAAQATLGEPYQVFIMTPTAIEAYRSGRRLSTLLTQTNMWYFLVMVGEEPRTILIVDLMQGEWQAVAIGGLDLPKNLAAGKQALPGLLATRLAASHVTKFVRVPQAHAEFITVESGEEDYVMPVMTRPQSLTIENLRMYTVDEIMTKLRPTVEKNIQLDQDGTQATFGGGSAHADSEQPFYLYGLGLLGALLLSGVTVVVFNLKKRV